MNLKKSLQRLYRNSYSSPYPMLLPLGQVASGPNPVLRPLFLPRLTLPAEKLDIYFSRLKHSANIFLFFLVSGHKNIPGSSVLCDLVTTDKLPCLGKTLAHSTLWISYKGHTVEAHYDDKGMCLNKLVKMVFSGAGPTGCHQWHTVPSACFLSAVKTPPLSGSRTYPSH